MQTRRVCSNVPIGRNPGDKARDINNNRGGKIVDNQAVKLLSISSKKAVQ